MLMYVLAVAELQCLCMFWQWLSCDAYVFLALAEFSAYIFLTVTELQCLCIFWL